MDVFSMDVSGCSNNPKLGNEFHRQGMSEWEIEVFVFIFTVLNVQLEQEGATNDCGMEIRQAVWGEDKTNKMTEMTKHKKSPAVYTPVFCVLVY